MFSCRGKISWIPITNGIPHSASEPKVRCCLFMRDGVYCFAVGVTNDDRKPLMRETLVWESTLWPSSTRLVFKRRGPTKWYSFYLVYSAFLRWLVQLVLFAFYVLTYSLALAHTTMEVNCLKKESLSLALLERFHLAKTTPAWSDFQSSFRVSRKILETSVAYMHRSPQILVRTFSTSQIYKLWFRSNIFRSSCISPRLDMALVPTLFIGGLMLFAIVFVATSVSWLCHGNFLVCRIRDKFRRCWWVCLVMTNDVISTLMLLLTSFFFKWDLQEVDQPERDARGWFGSLMFTRFIFNPDFSLGTLLLRRNLISGTTSFVTVLWPVPFTQRFLVGQLFGAKTLVSLEFFK